MSAGRRSLDPSYRTFAGNIAGTTEQGHSIPGVTSNGGTLVTVPPAPDGDTNALHWQFSNKGVGKNFTGSAWIHNIGEYNITVRFSNGISSLTTQIISPGEIAKVEIKGLSTHEYTHRFVITRGSKDHEIKIVGYQLQVEEKPYATPFVDGIRQTRLADSTPYGNHGTSAIENSPTLGSDRFGKDNSTISFYSDTDIIYIPHNEAIDFNNNDNFTLSTWVKVNGTDARASIIHKGGGRESYGISFHSTSFEMGARVEEGYFSAREPIIFNEWTHLVLIAKNSIFYGYVNGVLVDQSDYSEISDFSNTDNWRIGKISGIAGGSINLDWLQDDIRIYNRALSPEEISLLYDSYKPQLQVSSLNSGLIGHWSLNEVDYNPSSFRVSDLTPYSNHGINNGATFTSDRFDNEGAAMNFNGSSNYININNYSNYNNEMSMSAWFRFLGENNTGRFAIVSMNRQFFEIRSDPSWRIRFWPNHGSGTSKSWTPNSEWNHIVGTIKKTSDDTTNLKVYLNGELWDESNRGIFDLNNTNKEIGSRGSGSFFNGSIDDVRIYNRALSPEEISQLYNSYKPKITPSLQKGLVLGMPLTEADYNPDTGVISNRSPYNINANNIGGTFINNEIYFNRPSYLSLGTPGELDFQPEDSFSMGGWISVEELYPLWHVPLQRWLNTVSVFVGRGSTGRSVGIGVAGYWSDTGDPNINPDFVGARFVIGSRGETQLSYTSSYINLNEFYHLFFVYTPGMQYTYINGELVNSRNNTTGLTGFFSGDWNIFRNRAVPGGNGWDMSGTAKDVRIYNRALSPEEVQLLYSRGR